MPMAAMLAHARVVEGTPRPAIVTVLQRDSPSSGWKVGAINQRRSPIGGIEPDLDRLVAESVAAGLLRATHDPGDIADADVVLVCVQTDKKGIGPDYGPMMEALEGVAAALARRPAGNLPLVIFESTLAPSSMASVMRPYFARHGLEEGRDVLLGNSPNRVMPGRLVERVASSDKVVAGLDPRTPGLVRRLYSRIVTGGRLIEANSLTAEVVKTLENAYRDVRIAYSTEIARYCDRRAIDFYAVRDEVNRRLSQGDGASANPTAVPSGAVLIPTVGVGGHCLPKDGILLWWRAAEAGVNTTRSLIHAARRINDDSPAETIALAERALGPIAGEHVAVMGAAYRFDSEDTRNSPSLVLSRLLQERGCVVTIHDPFVKPDDQNLVRLGLRTIFTRDAGLALAAASVAFFCTGHTAYAGGLDDLLAAAPRLRAVVDGCNLYRREQIEGRGVSYAGIGRGQGPVPEGFATFVLDGFRVLEHGMANELVRLVDFLNERVAADRYNWVAFDEVRRIAGTCATGCRIAEPRAALRAPAWDGFTPRLVALSARG
jgi:UDP-N-acetyl-D-mannosaminuronic acid dehydrogenase